MKKNSPMLIFAFSQIAGCIIEGIIEPHFLFKIIYYIGVLAAAYYAYIGWSKLFLKKKDIEHNPLFCIVAAIISCGISWFYTYDKFSTVIPANPFNAILSFVFYLLFLILIDFFIALLVSVVTCIFNKYRC